MPGYGAGGCGGGAAGCSSYPSADAGENFTGDGARGLLQLNGTIFQTVEAAVAAVLFCLCKAVFVTPGEDLTVGIGAGAIGARKNCYKFNR